MVELPIGSIDLNKKDLDDCYLGTLYYKQDIVSSELMYMKTANMQKGDKICMAWICNIYVI